ncbi:hypothetical protein Tco_0411559 [Tanacetum coccineum]
MKRVSRGYSGIDFSLFPTMITVPETSPSIIISSPSLSPQHTPVSTLSTSQPPNTQPTLDVEEAVLMPHESPLHNVHLLRRDDGSLSLNELTDLCTSLSKKVEGLESELKQTKQTYSSALTKLILRVKKLEQIVKDEGTSWIQEDIEIQEKISDDTEVVLEEEEHTELVEDQEVSTAANLVYIIRSAQKRKDKGKAIMQESEPPKKVKKRVQVQMSMDEELAKKVFEEEQAKAMAEQEQERINFEAALELQKQLDEREEVATEPTQAQKID